MKKLISCLMFGLIPLQAFSAHTITGGSASSGGGDNLLPQTGSAWFLRTREIKTCIDVSSQFGFSEAELQATILEAADTWGQYILKKGIYTEPYDRDRAIYLDHKRVIFRKCDGEEDLKFYFGSSNLEVERSKADHQDPIGFANRSSYDVQAEWGKGFVWVALPNAISPGYPNWRAKNNLLGMLLHEFGHILGCGHVDGTIMTANIGAVIRSNHNGNDPFFYLRLPKVDQDRELVEAQKNSARQYQGTLRPVIDMGEPPQGEAGTFKIFTGRAPVGTVSATLKSIGAPVAVELKDDLRAVTVPLHIGTGGSNLSSTDIGYGGGNLDTPLFKVYAPNEWVNGVPISFGENHLNTQIGVIFGIVQGAHGENYLFNLQYNGRALGTPVQIFYASMTDKLAGTLFFAKGN